MPGPEDIVLRLSGITKRFGPLVANDAISLDLRRGEVLALLGENGAGKTTLMNILFGHYVADEGTIEVRGEALPAGSPRAALSRGIGMVHQHFTLADNLTVLDNIVLGTEPLWRIRSLRSRARARLAELSADFGLAIEADRLVGDLSVGERQRVEILKALYRNARILILDEPTAVLTPQETEALFATLRRMVDGGLSVIFISHKLNEVMAVAGRVIVLRQGKLVAERETATTDRHELAELMVGRTIPEPTVDRVAPGPAVLELRNVTVASAKAERAMLSDVSMILHVGEIMGIAGVSGNGQSTLADLLSGIARPTAGSSPRARNPRSGRAHDRSCLREFPRTDTRSVSSATFRSRKTSSPPITALRPSPAGASSTGTRCGNSPAASSPSTTFAVRARAPSPGFSRAATCRS
jgi:simple sugar transport system ATP-binding protein